MSPETATTDAPTETADPIQHGGAEASPSWLDLGDGLELNERAATPRARQLLEAGAVTLVAELHRALDAERRALLRARDERQADFDRGAVPEYLDRKSEAVAGSWRVAEIPADLRRRRVEITGPVNDTKMVIKMLSRNDEGHRADCAMVDFEDSMKPSWKNVVDGVHNVIGAVHKELTYIKPAQGGRPERLYALDPSDMAKLIVRVRGLHLAESNVRVDGEPIAGGLLDLALCLYHAALPQMEKGETPAFYVPKCEHYLEARWWNRLFELAQEKVGVPSGTLRATFLIETLPAAFQIEEILYEIRDHAAGLNVGRWDKIFSDIKVLAAHPDRILADRASISLNRPWMKAYARRLIRICHRRGAFAIGGMAAFTPGGTAELRQHQTSKVIEDKQLEFELGHDGCWVSHPYFLGPALEAFPASDQLHATLDEADHYPADLLPEGTPPRTLEGLRTNVRVGIAYLEGWRRDLGCVAWDNLMEDLATLEISRAQTWQWLHHGVELGDGLRVDEDLVRRIFAEELERIRAELDDELGAESGPVKARFTAAAAKAEEIFCEAELRPFLTTSSELV
ncbi:MAG: malate synthase [Holophagales bacterium]|nr:malate synthase [Holophagales bacterium]